MEISGSESQTSLNPQCPLIPNSQCDELVIWLQQSLGHSVSDYWFPDDPVWPPGQREKRMEQRQHPTLGNTAQHGAYVETAIQCQR
ncbi:hypothetical protein XENTR_v10006730 [Xenopus tropicalis]|nr:hypothetical protein XENTR_v10006730 [Xenopus tropicalis]